jgi:hypothetical protein
MPVTNEAGQVALANRQPIPKLVSIRNKEYLFSVQHAVSLAWIDPEDVPSVLAIVGGCCNNRQPQFRVANDMQVKVWQVGHY